MWRLDRLGRRMIALLGFVEELRERGCDFRILNGSFPIDTTTAQGRLLFHISAALAENERDVIRERTIAGLASARAHGRKGGRPAKLTAKQVCTARKMLADPRDDNQRGRRGLWRQPGDNLSFARPRQLRQRSHGRRCMMKTPVMDEVDRTSILRAGRPVGYR
jgi:Resolvase, N terminal domain